MKTSCLWVTTRPTAARRPWRPEGPIPHRTGLVRAVRSPLPDLRQARARRLVLNRLIRALAYQRVAGLDITYGESRTRCVCCSRFRTYSPGVAPRARPDEQGPPVC